MPRLSIVLIEYFSVDDIIVAVDSVHNNIKDVDYEIVVVSNSEYDHQAADSFKSRLGNDRLILSETNSGYAGGVNLALSVTDSDFIFLLNPDGKLVDSHFSNLINQMENDHTIAVIGPRVIDEDGTVQPSCRRFPRPYSFLLVRSFLRRFPFSSNERKRYLMEDFDRTTIRDVDWVSGGAMLLRRSAIDQVGGMDERYFLYMEDVDWCRRFNQQGWRVVYNPATTVLHAGRHSSIKPGFKMLTSKTLRWHLQSLFKYFLKYSFR